MVFVHGLGGHPEGTWRCGEDGACTWPKWLGEDFPQVAVWSLEYAASPSRWTRGLRWIGRGSRDSGHAMALPERARDVLNELVLQGLGERPILFICHSLGGLLVKQVLRRASDTKDPRLHRIAEQTRAVLFLATPHRGASLASLAGHFRVLFGATVSVEELDAHDAHLSDLFEWYRDNAPGLSIETQNYYEKREVSGVLIVAAAFADAGLGSAIPLDEDHLSIAKPRERAASVCLAARDLLKRCVLAPRPAPAPAPATGGPHEIADPTPSLQVTGSPPPETSRIPREMPPPAHRFFGRTVERRRLAERLRAGQSTAVVGLAGMGKTALAAAALADVVGEEAERLAESPFPDGLVFLDLYELRGDAESAWNTLANKLRGPQYLESHPAVERGTEACRGRRLLLILEGGETADGEEGRARFAELVGVLSPEGRWLLLTRPEGPRVEAVATVTLDEALGADDAAALLDLHSQGRPLDPAVRAAVLELLAGHPLALTWAGSLLAQPEEDPAELSAEWRAQGLPALSDPEARRTLRWLFERSLRGLDAVARAALAATGLLAHTPFPSAAVAAALGGEPGQPAGEAAVQEARAVLKVLARRGLLRRDGDEWQHSHVLGYQFARTMEGGDPAALERLGGWMHEWLSEALRPGADAAGFAALAPLLQHATGLLQKDGEQRLWEPLAQGLLYEIADRLEAIGRLDLVRQALDAVGEWLAGLPPSQSVQPYWRSKYVAVTVRRADVLSVQGDLAGVLAGYREALAVSESLAEAEPSNLPLQRDLSVSLNRIGDVLRDQGNLDGALADYQNALAVIRRLAEAEPTNAGWQRDLSVSQERVGDVLRDQGDLDGALDAYQKALAVRRPPAEDDPTNAGWQHDLGASLSKVSDVLQDQGNLDGALSHYREALAVIRRLAEADPTNAGWQRDLSVSLNKVGDVLRDQGDLVDALTQFNEALAVRRRLAEADPSNAGWQRDLGVSLNKVGDVLRDQGDLDGALDAYQQALTVRRPLAEADPTNAGWQRDLSVSQNKVGDVLRDQGDLDGALDAYQKALAVRRPLAEADPTNAGWQRDLSYSLTVIAQVLERQEDPAQALPLAEESLAIDERLAALAPTNVTWQRDVEVSRALVARLRAALA